MAIFAGWLFVTIVIIALVVSCADLLKDGGKPDE